MTVSVAQLLPLCPHVVIRDQALAMEPPDQARSLLDGRLTLFATRFLLRFGHGNPSVNAVLGVRGGQVENLSAIDPIRLQHLPESFPIKSDGAVTDCNEVGNS